VSSSRAGSASVASAERLAPLLEALYARLGPEDKARFQRSFDEAIDACKREP
jgi:hypothetical protein